MQTPNGIEDVGPDKNSHRRLPVREERTLLFDVVSDPATPLPPRADITGADVFQQLQAGQVPAAWPAATHELQACSASIEALLDRVQVEAGPDIVKLPPNAEMEAFATAYYRFLGQLAPVEHRKGEASATEHYSLRVDYLALDPEEALALASLLGPATISPVQAHYGTRLIAGLDSTSPVYQEILRGMRTSALHGLLVQHLERTDVQDELLGAARDHAIVARDRAALAQRAAQHLPAVMEGLRALHARHTERFAITAARPAGHTR